MSLKLFLFLLECVEGSEGLMNCKCMFLLTGLNLDTTLYLQKVSFLACTSSCSTTHPNTL